MEETGRERDVYICTWMLVVVVLVKLLQLLFPNVIYKSCRWVGGGIAVDFNCV